MIKRWNNIISSSGTNRSKSRTKRKGESLRRRCSNNPIRPAIVELKIGGGGSSSTSPATTATPRLRDRLRRRDAHANVRILAHALAMVPLVFAFAHAFGLLAVAGLQNCHSAAAQTLSSTKKSQCLHMAAGQAPSGMHCDDCTSGGLDDQLQ